MPALAAAVAVAVAWAFPGCGGGVVVSVLFFFAVAAVRASVCWGGLFVFRFVVVGVAVRVVRVVPAAFVGVAVSVFVGGRGVARVVTLVVFFWVVVA